jgi:hypothetical protein
MLRLEYSREHRLVLFTTATLLGAGAKFAAATKQAQQPPPQQKQAKQ